MKPASLNYFLMQQLGYLEILIKDFIIITLVSPSDHNFLKVP